MRMCHDRAGTFVSWAGTPKVTYLYRCSINFSKCPLEYSREILPPTFHQRSSSWQTNSGGCEQVFVLLKVRKRDVLLFKLGHNLFPVSHSSRCLGPAVLPVLPSRL